MKHSIDKDVAEKIAAWIARGDQIAVWQNCDLGSSSVGTKAFTPLEIGTDPVAPHWRYGHNPVAVESSMDAFEVIEWTEHARIKVRSGPPCFGYVNRADRKRLDKALAQAGEGANWRADYSTREYGSAWFTAIIETPSTLATA